MDSSLAVLWESLKNFMRNRGAERAAAISFYAFFSLIPVLLVITSALGVLLGTKAGVVDRVVESAREGLPYIGEQVVRDLKGISRKWNTYGWLGVVTLMWSAELALSSASNALSAIFGIEERLGFLRKRIINIVVLTLAIAAALISVYITMAAVFFSGVHFYVFGADLAQYLVIRLILKFALPFILTVCMVTLVYRISSAGNIDLRHAFYGSLIFSGLWEAAKFLFAWYVFMFPSYNKLYGSLGMLMLLLLWIFYSANIFLISASFARVSYLKSRASSPVGA